MKSEYIKARTQIEKIISSDLLGPGSERHSAFDDQEEVITDSIQTRYTVGMLYPQANDENALELQQEDEVVGDQNDDELAREESTVKKDRIIDSLDSEVADYEDVTYLTTTFTPSAMGISFIAEGKDDIEINITAAHYISIASQKEKRHQKCRAKCFCGKDFQLTEDECKVLRDGNIELKDSALQFTASVNDESLEQLIPNLISSVLKRFSTNFIDEFKTSTDKVLGKVLSWKVLSNYILEKISSDFSTEVQLLKVIHELIFSVNKLLQQYKFGYKRIPITKSDILLNQIKKNGLVIHKYKDNPSLILRKIEKKVRNSNAYMVSLFLVNQTKDNDGLIYCQPEIRAASTESQIVAFGTSDKEHHDGEENMLRMLYRKKLLFARGHACSVSWKVDSTDYTRADEVVTTFLPTKAIKALSWEITPAASIEEEDIKASLLLDNYTFDKEKEIISNLKSFNENYQHWINEQDNLCGEDESLNPYKTVAGSNINQCRKVYNRINNSIEFLSNDDLVLKAFCWANEAVAKCLNKKLKEDVVPAWRPFQLGFILLSLESIAKEESTDRNTVDLLWFPTGGGKTEAYLCLTAFSIFYSRLTGKEAGTNVIMRYTLRLLTAQQFNRASALICACDELKEEKGIAGEKITIGLWVGGSGDDGIPNKFAGGRIKCQELKRNYNPDENPFQPTTCPWCNTPLIQNNDMGYDGANNSFEIYCLNDDCKYCETPLPIQIIDEGLYQTPPTLLFATVDKFALLPWKKESGIFFGMRGGKRTYPPPNLIIQDELHLITEELGSMTGIYETAIHELCMACNGIKPKIIASTATTRRAEEQCKKLYDCSDVYQFPPAGLNIEDSYFSKEKRSDNRQYMGIMSLGKTQSTTLIRAIATLLFRIKHLSNTSEEIIDLYYTLVAYFNSLRELGAAETWTHSDILERIQHIANYEGLERRRVNDPVLLCSRRKSNEIPGILHRLEHNHYPDGNPVNILLASNMLSVGIDVDRFGLMVVNGHPKKNAEYIQATSRVGRKEDGSGLVLTVYNGSKARDRSYFEIFPDYIQAFYKYVEPATVTPFTKAARKKALCAVFISIIRHTYRELNNNDNLINWADYHDDFITLKDRIIQRVTNTDEEEATAAEENLQQIINNISEWVKNDDIISYGFLGGNCQETDLLVPSDKFKEECECKYPAATSLRNVDKSALMNLVD